ncbi:MAG: helix-turn-helix transcriptional regulator [Planctomycetes bacterium]|nr:helix-turn-helix transcriptional regulator [Planctomycetota bacterium]
MARRASASDPGLAVRDLCAHVFQQPERLVQATRLRVEGNFKLEPHAHRDLLQMDFAAGCGGFWYREGARLHPKGPTAAVFYPGQEHGYAFQALHAGATIFSFKLRVERRWPAIRQRVFPSETLGVAGEEPLMRALARIARLAVAPGPQRPLLASSVAEALCLWPDGTARRNREGASAPEGGLDARLEAAAALINERLARPPSLEELAHAAHLSPRHLARVFLAVQGCTPHEYATARRLVRARELLVQGSLNVTKVAEALGFPEIHTFSRWFRREAGVSPAEYCERGRLL